MLYTWYAWLNYKTGLPLSIKNYPLLTSRLGLSSLQKLETNYYDPMYKDCLISASTAPRHLKIGRERAYTIVFHRMDLFLNRSDNNINRNRKEALY